MWEDVLQDLNERDWRTKRLDIKSQTKMLMCKFELRLFDWRFNIESYTKAVYEAWGVQLPTHPLGGIFVTRLPNKQVLMSLDWHRLPDAWPILEFFLA